MPRLVKGVTLSDAALGDWEEWAPSVVLLIACARGGTGCAKAAEPRPLGITPNSVKNASTGNEISTYTYNGRTYQVNTGHAFTRPHRSGDFSNSATTGLTHEQVETAIVANLDSYIANGGSIPTAAQGVKPQEIFINVVEPGGGLVRIGYTVVRLPNGTYSIGTYWPQTKP
jgi:hypothetical protein